jgi:cytochrome c biogenesis protein CcmG/thiol:disulfide interchange protein DsbE
MRRWLALLPVAIVVVVVAGFVWRLANPPDPVVESQMVGRKVPDFVLPAALPARPGLSSASLATGEPRLVNLFASWCVPCIAEAPVLEELRRQGVSIDGIAIRDRPEDLAAFLERHGDPFERIGADYGSRVQLALGSAGVPESFVVDGRGVIRYQHVGPIMPGHIPTILAELEKAE